MLSSACNDTLDCDGELACIDTRCMCNPLLAHTGIDCDGLRWNSWALVISLALISVLSVAMLASEAKKLSRASSRRGSGLGRLAIMLFRPTGTDAGSTTVRVVLVSVTFDIVSYAWKILAALSFTFESTFDYWDARVFYPLSEGLVVLPTAIVVSVWMDVANSTLSRSKSKARLKRTRKMLRFGTAFYIILLLLLCVFGRRHWAAIVQMGATLVGLSACGSGAAKLCSTLRALGQSSASIANNVFVVSRSMGICLYAMFGSEVLLLSSHTRKSDPANLALIGMMGYALAKCFLNKSILEYMIDNVARKEVRSRNLEMSMAAGSPERSTLIPSRRGKGSLTPSIEVDRNESKHDNDNRVTGSSAMNPPPVSLPNRPLRRVAVEN